MHPRSIVAALSLGLLAAAAQADTWEFSYTGATSADAPFPLTTLDGRFAGDDRDGDGVIRADELQSLSFFHYTIAPTTDMGLPAAPEGTLSSELRHFEFGLASQTLAFDAKAGSWHDAYDKQGDTLLYATGIGQFTFDLSAATLMVRRLEVSLPLASAAQPVPEPATWGLMLAGMVGLGAWSRRRLGATAAR